MPNKPISPETPSLIQEPEGSLRTITFPTPGKKTVTFNVTKIFAAVGAILIVTVLAIAAFWIWLQTQEPAAAPQVETVKVSTDSAKPATISATPSAN